MEEVEKISKAKEELDSLHIGFVVDNIMTTFVDNIMSTTNTYISTFINSIYLHFYSIMV